MWLEKSGLNQIDDSIFEIIGKALFIAQKYEITCKDIVSMFLAIETVLVPNTNASLDEFISYSERLRKLFLGQLINIANDKIRDQLTEDNLAILDKGTKSRNWLVHQCCKKLIAENVTRTKPKIDISDFPFHIQNLLAADFLVSKWSFEFHEKERAYISKEKYIDSILEWAIP